MRWQLYDKRLELLKAIKHQDTVYNRHHEQHTIGEMLRLYIYKKFNSIDHTVYKAFNAFAIEVVAEHLYLKTRIHVHSVTPHLKCRLVLSVVSRSKVCYLVTW